MLPLDGRTAVVTGAAGGIGAPVAGLLREAGAWVIGVDRGPSPACDESLVVDLAKRDQLAELADTLTQRTPDLLVNIAGVMRFGLLEEQAADAVELCYRVNLLVPSVLAQAVAGPMRRRGSGQIVNIGSVLGAIPYPWFAAYSASKAGLAALSQALRRELDGSGVGVTHVSPRAARTRFNDGEVNRFLQHTGMKADEPDWVAQRIVKAILARRDHVTIGPMERFYSALNAVVPQLIDRSLSSQVRRARTEFSQT